MVWELAAMDHLSDSQIATLRGLLTDERDALLRRGEQIVAAAAWMREIGSGSWAS